MQKMFSYKCRRHVYFKYLLILIMLFGLLPSIRAEDSVLITGNPSILTHQGKLHIFARDTNGHLRVWWRTKKSDWQLEDLTKIVGGQKIKGNPISYNDKGILHIFVRDPNKHLREWWWRAVDGWHLEDLTLAGETIIGDPFYFNNNQGIQYVFAQDSDGDLRLWWWTVTTGWSSIDLTHFEGLNLNIETHLGGNPLFATEYNGMLHIYARNGNGHLIQWWWTAKHGLHIEDLTAQVGGQTIVGTPAVYSYITPNHRQVSYPYEVFARSPDGHLLKWQWQWQPKNGWNLKDLHKNSFIDISNSGEIIASDPSVCSRQEIFVRDSSGNLKSWRYLSDTWQVTNLTAVPGGKTIAGDPISYCPGNNVKEIFARDSDGHLRHWHFTGTGWIAKEIK